MRPQHLQALDLANGVRYERAALRAAVHQAAPEEGRRIVARLLEDEHGCESGVVSRMPALRLLSWPPRIGPKAALRMLRQVGVVSELRLVRDLTGRQRRSLAATLRGHGEETA